MFKKIGALFFQNRDTRQTIAKNVFWLSVGQLGSRVLRAAIIIYAARVLGVAEYGVFSYALGLASFFTIFADIGVSQILTREASREPKSASSYFATSFWIKSTLLLFTALLVILVAPSFSKIEAAKNLLPFVALLVIFDNLREFSNAFFRAKERMEFEALITVAMNTVIVIFGFVALYFYPTAKSITFSYISSAGAGFMAAIFLLREEWSRILVNFNPRLILPIMQSAWPIALLSLLGAFMLNVDIIMLGWFRSAAEIGLYSAGQKVAQIFYTLPTIIASAIFPALSRAVNQEEKQKATLIMEKGLAVVFFIALPLTAGGIALSESILRFLYGQEYIAGSTAFQILIATILVVFPGPLLGNLVLAYDKQKKIAGYVALTSLGNVILNFLLIPRFGIVGAATATLVVQVMYIGLIWEMMKRINYFKILPHLKKMSVAAVLMGTLSFILNKIGLSVLVNITISGAFYIAALCLLKENLVEEGKFLLKVIRK